MATVQTSNKTVDQLNSFLRGEISAVETYRLALKKLDNGSAARNELESCMRSHEERVSSLRSMVQQLGGKPVEGSGAWGTFTKVVEGSAAAFGDKIAITALEEGEDHGLRDYRTDLSKLEGSARQIVVSELLPKQEQTHRTLSDLKHRIH
jgi:uncharacterized protein (TIGR02284 family)